MDAAHWYGEDLALSASGDLLMADGVDLCNQRIVRRLMTTEGGYCWHPDYGGSVPLRVGGLNGALPDENALGLLSVNAVVRTQMFLEESVQQDPEPTVAISPINGGVFVSVQYIDALSGDNASLDFDVVL
jgi:hypothetical protein